MRWLTALLIGGILAFVLPLSLGGQDGAWMHSFAKWGTVRPVAGSPGFLFSLPVFLISAIALRFFFNWHRN